MESTHWENLLQKLCEAFGPAGFEDGAASAIAAELDGLGLSVSKDALGSLHVFLPCGRENAPLLMLDAHMDEIGMIVSAVSDDGFLKFAPVGGLDPRLLPGSEVTLLTEPPTHGIVCCLPPHVQTPEEMNSFAKIADMGIDTGLPQDELRAKVPLGTFAVSAAQAKPLAFGRFAAKALDNRAMCAVLIETLKRLAENKPEIDVAAVFSVQEEVGCRGAGPAAFGLLPDAAVVLDVTFAKAPGLSDEESFPFGSLTVCLGPFVDRNLSKALLAQGKAMDIPIVEEVYGGSTGTNATAIALTQTGVPCAVLSVPVRYLHSPQEVVAPADLESAAVLLEGFVRNFPKEGRRK